MFFFLQVLCLVIAVLKVLNYVGECWYDYNSLYLFFIQAADIKILGSLNRDDLKKICGDNFPVWISFPVYEQVGEISVD